jgi:hypothetical protein
MLENYLLNLYKNLTFYNNLNINDINKLKHTLVQKGGSSSEDIIKFNAVFGKIFENIKTDILSLKKTSPEINQAELNAKLRIFYVVSELYHFYLTELMAQHSELGEKLTELNEMAEGKGPTASMAEIAQMFKDLLGD